MNKEQEQIKSVFVTEQEELSEAINFKLFEKPKHDKIKKEMQEFLEGLRE